jgi:hypothetical protein
MVSMERSAHDIFRLSAPSLETDRDHIASAS